MSWETDAKYILRMLDDFDKRLKFQERLETPVIGDWTSYTPSWTATTTNPSIGNGTLSGEYLQIGNIVHVALTMRAGSTTTFGSGDWLFNYPVPPDTGNANIYQVGTSYAFDSGTRYFGFTQYAGSSKWTAVLSGNYVNSASPMVWSAANGDYLEVNFWYKAA